MQGLACPGACPAVHALAPLDQARRVSGQGPGAPQMGPAGWQSWGHSRNCLGTLAAMLSLLQSLQQHRHSSFVPSFIETSGRRLVTN